MGQVTESEVGRGVAAPSTVRPIMTDATESKARTGYESSGTEDEPQTDGGVSRRRFLGAAAALSALPIVGGVQAEETGPKVADVETGLGSTRTKIEPGSPVRSSLEVKEILTDETEISVVGYQYDDEGSEVEISICSSLMRGRLSCSPERAEELAEEFQLAAKAAREGK